MVFNISSEQQFKEKLADAGNKLVVVDCFATWCGPCKVIAPKFEAMSQEMTNVVFLKVDIEEVDEVAETYKISCMPTFLFFKEGKEVDRFSGASADAIKERITKLQ